MPKFSGDSKQWVPRVSLAKSCFGLSESAKTTKKVDCMETDVNEKSFSAMSLLNTQNIQYNIGCIFCNKESHQCIKCYESMDSSVEEKQQIIEGKKGCFTCLKSNRISNKCKFKPRSRVYCYAQP